MWTCSLTGRNAARRALRSWTTGWQQAPESTLDPKNESGPIPFTSSSLLGLAYVRIYLNLGPYRELETRDPVRIANALYKLPPVKRSDGVISALLYAAHALSIPVRLGIDRVARSQAFFWSVRHSLSALECGVLLSKWLHELSASATTAGPLSGRSSPAYPGYICVLFLTSSGFQDSEDRILHWVRCIVEEAYAAVDFDEEQSVFQGDPLSLSLAVLGIWAHFCEHTTYRWSPLTSSFSHCFTLACRLLTLGFEVKSNTQWPFINIIGSSLERYRELLTCNDSRGPATE